MDCFQEHICTYIYTHIQVISVYKNIYFKTLEYAGVGRGVKRSRQKKLVVLSLEGKEINYKNQKFVFKTVFLKLSPSCD